MFFWPYRNLNVDVSEAKCPYVVIVCRNNLVQHFMLGDTSQEIFCPEQTGVGSLRFELSVLKHIRNRHH